MTALCAPWLRPPTRPRGSARRARSLRPRAGPLHQAPSSGRPRVTRPRERATRDRPEPVSTASIRHHPSPERVRFSRARQSYPQWDPTRPAGEIPVVTSGRRSVERGGADAIDPRVGSNHLRSCVLVRRHRQQSRSAGIRSAHGRSRSGHRGRSHPGRTRYRSALSMLNHDRIVRARSGWLASFHRHSFRTLPSISASVSDALPRP